MRALPLTSRIFLAIVALSFVAPFLSSAPASASTFTLPPSGNTQALGAATDHGDMGNQSLNQPVVGMATLPDNSGYWLVASDGGIFAYNAPFLGSMGGQHLNAPIVGMAATPDGNGYWLVASDGGIFSYGTAHFYGSTGSMHLNQPIVGMASTVSGGGYWLAAADGGVFAYGNATYYGSGGAHGRIVSITRSGNANGYYFVSSAGAVVSTNYPTISYPSSNSSVGNTSYYTFEDLNNGLPARWDPCSGPIHYTISSYELPTGGETLVQNAIRELAEITGLRFQYDGLVSTPLDINADHNNGFEVGWLNPTEYTGISGSDGYTQVGWVDTNRGARMFAANVEILVSTTEPWYQPSAGVDGNYENVLKHEIGHALGLNHAPSSSEVMYATSQPSLTDYSGVGGGDLQGLADVSASLGCVS